MRGDVGIGRPTIIDIFRWPASSTSFSLSLSPILLIYKPISRWLDVQSPSFSFFPPVDPCLLRMWNHPFASRRPQGALDLSFEFVVEGAKFVLLDTRPLSTQPLSVHPLFTEQSSYWEGRAPQKRTEERECAADAAASRNCQSHLYILLQKEEEGKARGTIQQKVPTIGLFNRASKVRYYTEDFLIFNEDI